MAQGTYRQKLHVRWKGTRRWTKLKYLQLFRAKGGASKVAKGFSIGLAIEMFTLPTFGIAAALIPPFVYFFRASFAGALVGFLFGKLIYLPIAFLNNMVGSWLVPKAFVRHIHFHPHWLSHILRNALQLIVGGMVVGAVLGVLAYFPIKWLLEYYTYKRKEKRRLRKAQVISTSDQPKT